MVEPKMTAQENLESFIHNLCEKANSCLSKTSKTGIVLDDDYEKAEEAIDLATKASDLLRDLLYYAECRHQFKGKTCSTTQKNFEPLVNPVTPELF